MINPSKVFEVEEDVRAEVEARIGNLIAEIETLQGELNLENAKLKEQLRWRPVSEKPKEGQIVFAMIQTGWVVAQYLPDGEFYVDDGFNFGDMIGGVTSWLPIPPAPEGEVK